MEQFGDEIKSLFWFRRDLRINDNAGLYHALKSQDSVQCIFIFDEHILSKLENKADKRISFIYQSLLNLQDELAKYNSSLKVYYGSPEDLFTNIISKDFPNIEAVFCNHDYEPYAKSRDKHVEQILRDKGVVFNSYKDQVIFEKDEVVKADGSPYTVFTPYSKKWKAQCTDFHLKSYPTLKYTQRFAKSSFEVLPIEHIGFEKVEVNTAFSLPTHGFLKDYEELRDFPSKKGTSRLSVHLRFGTLSIRQLAKKANEAADDSYLNELIWRDFYQMILWHFPHVVNSAFKAKYNFIPWRNNESEFEKWCSGNTGIPIVDAGMRELNETGFMHNRVRMIVASFLTKNLLIDWRWGEAYFAEKLLDFDLAANNGGWQWAASTGCDAAPYFRVFNPESQAKKFDPNGIYIRNWVPELNELNYPQPMVDLKESRKRAIEVYKQSLASVDD